jgi:16S rRNA (adenine(1408)-N(1))-methyltransferase
MFLLGTAERPPAELERLANHVTVQFPWGSLLRGCVGEDEAVAAGIASLVAPGGELELLLAPATRDRLDGLPTEPAAIVAAAARAFEPFGFGPVEGRVATEDEIRATRSTWARRLLAGLAGGRHAPAASDRTAVLVRLRSWPA